MGSRHHQIIVEVTYLPKYCWCYRRAVAHQQEHVQALLCHQRGLIKWRSGVRDEHGAQYLHQSYKGKVPIEEG